MSIVLLEKTIMTDRTGVAKEYTMVFNWLIREGENELMSREKAGAELLGKQNGQQFSLLNLGKAILFFHKEKREYEAWGAAGVENQTMWRKWSYEPKYFS